MSFLPERRTSLDSPPRFPEGSADEEKKPRPAIQKMLGATPWFNVSVESVTEAEEVNLGRSKKRDEEEDEGDRWSAVSMNDDEEKTQDGHVRLVTEDKWTQTEADPLSSYEEVENLKAQVQTLLHEREIWIEKIERAKEKKRNLQRGKKRISSKPRLFVNTVGDLHHKEFNAMLLGLINEVKE